VAAAGSGLIGGLDAWHVLSTPPLSEADLAGADDRDEELRRLTRRRRLRHHIGAHTILNVFIVGVWLASGSTYFWPAWVMLGSATAIALHALRPSGRLSRVASAES
jgi:2TM domain-containing protein